MSSHVASFLPARKLALTLFVNSCTIFVILTIFFTVFSDSAIVFIGQLFGITVAIHSIESRYNMNKHFYIMSPDELATLEVTGISLDDAVNKSFNTDPNAYSFFEVH